MQTIYVSQSAYKDKRQHRRTKVEQQQQNEMLKGFFVVGFNENIKNSNTTLNERPKLSIYKNAKDICCLIKGHQCCRIFQRICMTL